MLDRRQVTVSLSETDQMRLNYLTKLVQIRLRLFRYLTPDCIKMFEYVGIFTVYTYTESNHIKSNNVQHRGTLPTLIFLPSHHKSGVNFFKLVEKASKNFYYILLLEKHFFPVKKSKIFSDENLHFLIRNFHLF